MISPTALSTPPITSTTSRAFPSPSAPTAEAAASTSPSGNASIRHRPGAVDAVTPSACRRAVDEPADGTSATATAISGSATITRAMLHGHGEKLVDDQSRPTTSSPRTTGCVSQKATRPDNAPTAAAAPASTAATTRVRPGGRPSTRRFARRRSRRAADRRATVASRTATGTPTVATTVSTRSGRPLPS